MKEKVFLHFIRVISLIFILLFAVVLIHLINESMLSFKNVGLSLFEYRGEWRPLSNSPQYSIMPMIFGTLSVSFLAVLISLPLCIATAICFAFYVKEKYVSVMLSFIDLLAGIPSVIFGFIGLMVLVARFEDFFSMPTGECLLLGAIVLAIMLFPFCVSSIYESIVSIKKTYYFSAIALGYSKEYIILKIILKLLLPSIYSSFIMALGRAMGETMAVMMVIGNSPLYPRLLKRILTIPALTALEMGNAEYGSLHLSSIYAANLILLIILVLLMSIAKIIQKWTMKTYEKN